MKIILVYPPQRNYQGFGQDRRWLPLGISSICAYLKHKDDKLDVVCLDLFEYTIEKAIIEITKYLDLNGLNIIGFTCLTEQRISVFELCNNLKKIEDSNKYNTKIVNVIGGAHAQIMCNQIADNYKSIDHIICGEGEVAFYNLVQNYILNKESDKIIQAENVKDLSELPHAIDGFKLFKTNLKIEEAPIIFGRGCTDFCTFCSTTKFWKGYRSRNYKNVFEEMLKYNKLYGCTYFKFHDDAATADVINLKNLCKLIIESQNKWQYEMTARADQFDNELISLLKESGCNQINVGIESGNEEQRKKMNKNLDIDLAKENIKKLKDVGIKVGLLFIVGYPGESDETIQETCNFIREVKPYVSYRQTLMIFPGTKVYRDLVKEKWIDDDYWLKDQPQPYYYKEQTPRQINTWMNKINMAHTTINVLIVVPARQKESKFQLHVESLNRLKIPEYVELQRLFILHNSDNLEKYLNSNDIIQKIHTNDEYCTDGNTHEWKDDNLKFITKLKNNVINNCIGFDYIFWVDSDLVLHENTLIDLLESGRDIISKIFWTDWNNNNIMGANAWDCDHYSYFSNDTITKYRNGGVHECGGTGACILINMEVYQSGVNYTKISNISFWGEDRNFCIRASVLGWKLYVSCNNEAFHIYRDSDIEKAEKILNGEKIDYKIESKKIETNNYNNKLKVFEVKYD